MRGHTRGTTRHWPSSRPPMSRLRVRNTSDDQDDASLGESTNVRELPPAPTTLTSHRQTSSHPTSSLRRKVDVEVRTGLPLGSELDLNSPESSPVKWSDIGESHQTIGRRSWTTTGTKGMGLRTGSGWDMDTLVGGLRLGWKCQGEGCEWVWREESGSDTLSQRSSQGAPSRPEPGDEQEDDDDETQHGFKQPSRGPSRHLRSHSTTSAALFDF